MNEIFESLMSIIPMFGAVIVMLAGITMVLRLRNGESPGIAVVMGGGSGLLLSFAPLVFQGLFDPSMPGVDVSTPEPPAESSPIEFNISTGAGIAIAAGVVALALVVGLVIVWPRVAAARDARMAAAVERKERAARVAAQRREAVASIEKVQADYGRLLMDVSYVIENSALFDLRFSPTRRFNDLLWQVQETRLDALDADQARDLSVQLSLAFREARQDAERLGFSALGNDAGKGRRAVLLATKAAGTDNEHERRALMDSLRAILDTIGVALPVETTKALEDVARKELGVRVELSESAVR